MDERMPEAALVETRSKTMGPSEKATVLVVEDEILLAMMAHDALVDEGYRVVMAVTADEAMDVLAKEKVDLVFSDIQMPGKHNGVELARHLRQRVPDLPVLLTSGYWGSAAREIPFDFLAKPYDIDDLLETIQRLIR
jgi:DNA-binding NtrC family response regulator